MNHKSCWPWIKPAVVASIIIVGSFLLSATSAHAATMSLPTNNLGLVGYWSFNETGGTIAHDYSGYGDTGTSGGSAAFVAGKSGNAINLTATSDYVSVPTSPAISLNTTVSISYWQNAPSQGGNFRNVIGKKTNPSGWVLQSDTTDRLRPRIDTSAGANQVSCYILSAFDGSWHHIVYVIDNGSIRCYKDGILQDTSTYNQGTGLAQTASDLYIGSAGGAAIGTYDDVRIYNRALTPTEVASIYNANAAKLGLATLKTPNNTGLVGYWSFDEATSTTATDSSGHGNVGTLSGSTKPSWISGKFGSALSFDGTGNTYVVSNSFSAVIGNTARTVAYWAKGTTANQIAISLGTVAGPGSANDAFALNFTSTSAATVYGRVSANDELAISLSKNPLDGKWHHIIVTWDGANPGTLNIYIDGVLAGTRTRSAGKAYATQAGIFVGRWIDANRYYNGSVDDVRVYSRALSATEIKALYSAGKVKINDSQNNKLTSGLVGLWSFDGADIKGSAAYDRSGQGNNGTLTNDQKPTIGKIGQALSFSGVNTHGIDVGTSTTLDPNRFTLAAWVYVNNPQIYNYNYIYSNTRDTFSPYYGIGFLVGARGNLVGRIANNTVNSITSVSTVATSTWTHAVFAYDGSTMKLYINGALDKSVAWGTDPGTPASFDTYLGSMGYNSGATYTLNGRLDDVRLYNRPLSASEIKQLYTIGR